LTHWGPSGERAPRLAVVLSTTSGILTVAAALALVLGWFWVVARGNWQAYVLWSYLFATPLLSGVSLAITKKWRVVKRLNLSLLGIWGSLALALLVVPFLA
jgi:hypothetical protein